MITPKLHSLCNGISPSEAEKIANSQFENVGDDGLFPNHTDKDIWVAGFRDALIWAFGK